jgi:hypothetical protein
LLQVLRRFKGTFRHGSEGSIGEDLRNWTYVSSF